MNRRGTVFALALAAGLCWGVGAGRADQDANLARGFSPDKLYAYSGLDSVNLHNGALTLTLPIGPRYPVGDQLSYGLTLSYGSNVWDPMVRTSNGGPKQVVMLPRRSSDAGLGWMLSLGGQLYGPAHPSEPPMQSAGYQFESEDGSIHVFQWSVHPDDPPQPGTPPCRFTRDNTYLRLCESGNTRTIEFPNGTQRTYTRLPTFAGMRPWDVDRFRLTRIEDRFGNWVDVAYGGGVWTITDSLGRSHTASFHFETVDGEPMWVLDFVDLEGFDGARSRYDFVYDEAVGGGVLLMEVQRSCKTDPEPLPSVDSIVDVPLLRKVLLSADESGFRMSFQMPDYNTACLGGNKDLPGTLERLDLPTGGRLEWTYQIYHFITLDPDYPEYDIVEQSTGVLTKTVLNEEGECDGGGSCTWLYDYEIIDNEHRKTLMTTPLGHTHVSYFRQQRPHPDAPPFTGWDQGLPFTTDVTEAGLFLSQEIRDAGGTLLRSVYVAYEHDELRSLGGLERWNQSYLQSNRRVKAQRTLYHDDPDNGVPRFTAVASGDFDGLGHHRSVTTSGNLGGSGAHAEYTDYNPDLGVYELEPGTNDPIPGYTPFPPHPHPWVIGTFESVRVEEPGSAFVSQYCFDPNTGRLERRRMQASASGPGSQDVIVRSTRVFDVLNEGQPDEMQAIYYDDFVYGGDLQDVSTGSQLCDILLPTAPPVYQTRNTQIDGTLAIIEPLHPANGDPILRTLDLAIDRSTGLAKTSTDPAGLAADYEYDKLGRLLWSKPRSGGDAWTEIRYCAASTDDPACDLPGDPANVTVRRRTNGNENGTVLEESRTVFDSFGRVAREDRKIPGHGWTVAETRYNAMGWVTDVTERGASGGGLPYSTRYLNHDPFGRPTLIKPPDFPDNPGHDITIDYLGVRWQQRGVSVATDLAGGETRYKTEEFRDHLGRLFRVRERNGAGNAFNKTDYTYDAAGRLDHVAMHGTVTQNRSFNYDGRGFLLSETHPENGTTHYSNYDAGGRVGRKRTGPQNGQFDLGFVYDEAQRLTEIRRWSDNQLLKEFTYGSGTTGADRSKGKIKTAVRHNHVLHPQNGSQHDVIATETYFYGGRGGRPSLRTTELSIGQTPAVKFSQSWDYNQLGQVSVLNYPVCIHSGSTCSPGNDERPRLVTFGRELGYLTAVPGWADAISYHANGMLDEVHHANGVVYQQGLDPHWMRRPASLGVTFPNNVLAPDIFVVPLPYAYDGAGNVKSWYDWRYRYDPVSRILEGSVDGGEAQSYTYDPFGNILTITTDLTGSPDPPPTTVQLGVDPTTNRLSASAYDDAGNLVSRGPFTYSYDPFSMMQTMDLDGGGTEKTSIYTADDERIWTVDSSDAPSLPWKETFTLRDLDGKVLRVFTTFDAFDFTNPTDDLDDLAWSQDYIYRDGQLLATARVAGAGETHHHFHLNHLGTPLLITDSEGGTEALHSYYPFGEELHPDTDAERMKFTGHERDLNEAGQTDDLDYMHARYYSPMLARFLSVDPANSAVFQRPQTWNRYPYARGNPLRFIDPDGRREKEPTKRRPNPFSIFEVIRHITDSHVMLIDAEEQRKLQDISRSMELLQAIDLIARGALPADTRTALEEIEDGSDRPNVRNPQPYRNDGSKGSQILPTHDEKGEPITYTEHTVNPRPPGEKLDARRVIEGSDGSLYYTEDHFKTFKRIDDSDELER